MTLQLFRFDIETVDAMIKKLGVSEIYSLAEKYEELRDHLKLNKGNLLV